MRIHLVGSTFGSTSDGVAVLGVVIGTTGTVSVGGRTVLVILSVSSGAGRLHSLLQALGRRRSSGRHHCLRVQAGPSTPTLFVER